MQAHEPPKLVDHFFRHEYGRLVALLSKRFGLRHLDLIEDTVQSALMAALQNWPKSGVPDDPSAWIYRVAKNRMLDAFRRAAVAQRLAHALAVGEVTRDVDPDQALDSDIDDSQLRLMFACGHPSLPAEGQIALTLKTLCGFSTVEVARALLISEENAKKRIARAKQRLVDAGIALDVPPAHELPARLDTVHRVLYLMFNEGYQAAEAEQPIRRDMCAEAARLCQILCRHEHCAVPATWALLALMLLHAARFDARLDEGGCLLLLEEQDRGKWDWTLIKQGMDCLARSAEGTAVTTYHLEAGIAFHHCKAASFAVTDWHAILKHYDMLVALDSSPVYALNRAIALAHVSGPKPALAALAAIRAHPQLQGYHLLDATLGELHRRAGDLVEARRHFAAALDMARAAADRQLLSRRMGMCD